MRLPNAADSRHRGQAVDAALLQRLTAMRDVLSGALDDGLADGRRLSHLADELDHAIDELASVDAQPQRDGGGRDGPPATLVVVKQFGSVARPAARSPIDELTRREREVLSLMARGKSNRAIADDLTLTKRAVEKHVGSIFMKLMLENEEIVSRRVGAVLLYLADSGDPDLAESFLTSPRA
jgi:DNA-binding NarL/FixJ family response regulator